jgi:hypothetical protein
MAGTVTTTEQRHKPVKVITFDWLSSTAGAADATTTYSHNGLIWKVEFIPDSGGTIPDDLYDVQVQDAAGTDLLDGGGSDLPQASTEVLGGVLAPVSAVDSKLTLAVTNAGSLNGGIVKVYIR